MNWIRIAPVSEIPLREGRPVRVAGLSLAVFRTESGFLAVENRCPHRGGPLADGIVGGTTVTCPLHNWRISLETGAVTRPCSVGAASVASFPVKVEDGILLVSLSEVAASAA